ncbi:hypothetical protein CRG98_038060 [Punica granatum]|uniref:Uncharacterized protein n=1 Tax=Punica granatum TaxID=22663 RepID=A0A2I0IC22_PUNGR|nr:hypothetical protein CRG98_038060 [Punica granatum]
MVTFITKEHSLFRCLRALRHPHCPSSLRSFARATSQVKATPESEHYSLGADEQATIVYTPIVPYNPWSLLQIAITRFCTMEPRLGANYTTVTCWYCPNEKYFLDQKQCERPDCVRVHFWDKERSISRPIGWRPTSMTGFKPCMIARSMITGGPLMQRSGFILEKILLDSSGPLQWQCGECMRISYTMRIFTMECLDPAIIDFMSRSDIQELLGEAVEAVNLLMENYK